MVVAAFHVVRITVYEPKTNAPLIVYGNSVLALAVILECVKVIAWWHFQVAQGRRQVDVLEFTGRSTGHIGWEPGRLAPEVQLSGAFVGDSLDHRANVACNVTRVNVRIVVALRQQQLLVKRHVRCWHILAPIVHDNSGGGSTSDWIDRDDHERAAIIGLIRPVAEHRLSTEEKDRIDKGGVWPSELYLIDIGDSRHWSSDSIERRRELAGEFTPVGADTTDDTSNVLGLCCARHSLATTPIHVRAIVRSEEIQLPIP